MMSRLSKALATVAVAASLMSHAAAAQELEQTDCFKLAGEQAMAACKEILKGNTDSRVFLRLGELLLEQRNFPEAVKVYERGLEIHPQNSRLQARLTVAKSGLAEWKWMQEVKKKEASKRAAAVNKADVFKCTRLANSAPNTALKSCDAALEGMPDDAELLEAKGDALQKLGNNAEAYLAYAAAAEQSDSAALGKKLAALAQYKPAPVVARAEPAPEPAPVVEPAPRREEAAPEPAPPSVVKPEPAPKTVAKAEPEPEPAVKTVVKAEPKPEPAAKAVVKAEPEPAPAAKTVVKAEPEPAPAAKTVVKAEPEPEPAAKAAARAEPAPATESRPEASPEPMPAPTRIVRRPSEPTPAVAEPATVVAKVESRLQTVDKVPTEAGADRSVENPYATPTDTDKPAANLTPDPSKWLPELPEAVKSVVDQAADQAALITAANARDKSLVERLEARNTLVSMARRAGSPAR